MLQPCAFSSTHPPTQQAKGDTLLPSAASYKHKLVLEAGQNVTHRLVLCPSQLAVGPWMLAVYSPLQGFATGYNLSVGLVGRCLANCSGHGSCSGEGVCRCDDGWLGGDCSVRNGSAIAGCDPGSRRAAPEVHAQGNGTCWQACECDAEGDDETCAYGDGCADYTCSASARRAGTALSCVVDECTRVRERC